MDEPNAKTAYIKGLDATRVHELTYACDWPGLHPVDLVWTRENGITLTQLAHRKLFIGGDA